MNAAKSNLAARVHVIVQTLRLVYPDFRCALNYETPLQLLVATILSAQCTDTRVNLVTPALFARYPTAAALGAAVPAELEALIRPTGFFRNKAKSIRNCCRELVACYHGQVPQSLEELVRLEGIGRKTANVVLGVAFGKAEGIVVDTHVLRLSRRIGLTRQDTPERAERALMRIVPQPDWIDFSHLLIWHGRNRCTSRNPDCVSCELRDLCPKRGIAKP